MIWNEYNHDDKNTWPTTTPREWIRVLFVSDDDGHIDFYSGYFTVIDGRRGMYPTFAPDVDDGVGIVIKWTDSTEVLS